MFARLSEVRSSEVPRRTTSIRSDMVAPRLSMLFSSTTIRSASVACLSCSGAHRRRTSPWEIQMTGVGRDEPARIRCSRTSAWAEPYQVAFTDPRPFRQY
eukprot:2030770-Pyramimonas_sp.AAC.1